MSILDFEGNDATGSCKKWDGTAGTGTDKDSCIANGFNWVTLSLSNLAVVKMVNCTRLKI